MSHWVLGMSVCFLIELVELSLEQVSVHPAEHFCNFCYHLILSRTPLTEVHILEYQRVNCNNCRIQTVMGVLLECLMPSFHRKDLQISLHSPKVLNQLRVQQQ